MKCCSLMMRRKVRHPNCAAICIPCREMWQKRLTLLNGGRWVIFWAAIVETSTYSPALGPCMIIPYACTYCTWCPSCLGFICPMQMAILWHQTDSSRPSGIIGFHFFWGDCDHEIHMGAGSLWYGHLECITGRRCWFVWLRRASPWWYWRFGLGQRHGR